ncbi:hypothetical protein BDN72DRAFT_959855 [Pluteus cervinus]|uniref:Uncharacterized protein n=1 Tax=Pluteus cervinus TaxID=181527 RepID=A0ACD3ASR9_9AGAR|nr:hypothetical protein BDN72DRAFT_959855 [Pluteus cervinus]
MAQRIRNWLRSKDRRQGPDGTTFPPELWSEIISTYLTLEEIRALSECSKFLRNISIPFLFKTFTVHPVVTYPDDWLAVIRRTLHRPPPLQIPNHIAQVIENVAIIPYDMPQRHDGTQTDRIFELLTTLPKLRHLVCNRVHFTQDLLNKLVHLPLKRLELSDSVMPSAPITVKIAGTLESVKLSFLEGPGQPPEQGRISFTRVLLRDSPNLASMHLSDDVTFPMIVTTPPPSLTSLNVWAEYISAVNFVDVLMACPSLRSISFSGCAYYIGTSGTGNLILPPGALPKLERYGGPFDIFPSFTNNRPTVKEMYLVCPYGFDSHSPPIPTIPTSIESVTWNLLSLDSVFSLLHPSLASESLTRLTIISPEWSLDRLPRLLSSNLVPLPNIRHITLKSVYDVTQSDSRSELNQILQESLPALLQVYPNLEEARIIPADNRWKSESAMVWRRSTRSSGWLKSIDIAIDAWWRD